MERRKEGQKEKLQIPLIGSGGPDGGAIMFMMIACSHRRIGAFSFFSIFMAK
jgi:hypothetical protein